MVSSCLSFRTVLFAFLSTSPQECWITLLKSVEEIKSTMRKKIGQQKIAAAVQRGLDTSADLTLPMRESSAHHRYTKNVRCSSDPQNSELFKHPPTKCDAPPFSLSLSPFSARSIAPTLPCARVFAASEPLNPKLFLIFGYLTWAMRRLIYASAKVLTTCGRKMRACLVLHRFRVNQNRKVISRKVISYRSRRKARVHRAPNGGRALLLVPENSPLPPKGGVGPCYRRKPPRT